MLEAHGNLWEVDADVRCITTNGDVNSRGQAVMGRGCALQAKQRHQGIEYRFGTLLRTHGNRAMRLTKTLWTFPVKHHWNEKADVELIEVSARQTVALANRFLPDGIIVIPRPGCGNGHLDWDDVKPVIEPLLDDRFTVITF